MKYFLTTAYILLMTSCLLFCSHCTTAHSPFRHYPMINDPVSELLRGHIKKVTMYRYTTGTRGNTDSMIFTYYFDIFHELDSAVLSDKRYFAFPGTPNEIRIYPDKKLKNKYYSLEDGKQGRYYTEQPAGVRSCTLTEYDHTGSKTKTTTFVYNGKGTKTEQKIVEMNADTVTGSYSYLYTSYPTKDSITYSIHTSVEGEQTYPRTMYMCIRQRDHIGNITRLEEVIGWTRFQYVYVYEYY